MENKMEKLFSELAIGTIFTFNGTMYMKTQDVRISCCKSINAVASTDSNNKIFVPPTTTVTING
jgi:hypothetical protein